MRKAPRNPEPAKRWAAFLNNHREAIAAMDFFTVPTLTFGVLYCFFVIAHDRRRILHCNVARAVAHGIHPKPMSQKRDMGHPNTTHVSKSRHGAPEYNPCLKSETWDTRIQPMSQNRDMGHPISWSHFRSGAVGISVWNQPMVRRRRSRWWAGSAKWWPSPG